MKNQTWKTKPFSPSLIPTDSLPLLLYNLIPFLSPSQSHYAKYTSMHLIINVSYALNSGAYRITYLTYMCRRIYSRFKPFLVAHFLSATDGHPPIHSTLRNGLRRNISRSVKDPVKATKPKPSRISLTRHSWNSQYTLHVLALTNVH